GGNFLDKMPRECLKIIKSNSKSLTSFTKLNLFQATSAYAGVSKTDFENYVKANDAILRNMQNQGQGSLPSNTVTNPKEDLKGITTRSGVVYQGPKIPTSSPKVVELSKPVDAPVSAPMPNPKPSIPYPSRRNDEKRRENADEQKEKFYEIFKDMSFEISFVDALTLMPKFASTLKALIRNKEKLSEMTRTPFFYTKHCLRWSYLTSYRKKNLVTRQIPYSW
ncbi:hypothetical protein Tco_0222074, partial [Tanacetum coccineum]